MLIVSEYIDYMRSLSQLYSGVLPLVLSDTTVPHTSYLATNIHLNILPVPPSLPPSPL